MEVEVEECLFLCVTVELESDHTAHRRLKAKRNEEGLRNHRNLEVFFCWLDYFNYNTLMMK